MSSTPEIRASGASGTGEGVRESAMRGSAKGGRVYAGAGMDRDQSFKMKIQ
jgi:hypothetical protein